MPSFGSRLLVTISGLKIGPSIVKCAFDVMMHWLVNSTATCPRRKRLGHMDTTTGRQHAAVMTLLSCFGIGDDRDTTTPAAYQYQVTRDGQYSRSNHARDAVNWLRVTSLGFGTLPCNESEEKSSTAVEVRSGWYRAEKPPNSNVRR